VKKAVYHRDIGPTGSMPQPKFIHHKRIRGIMMITQPILVKSVADFRVFHDRLSLAYRFPNRLRIPGVLC
jgi:hypothetical protein